MKKSIVMIGIGEVAGVFSRGFLRLGHPVVPVTRDMNIGNVAKECESPEAVVVAVGEKDLQSVLKTIPKIWFDKVVLIQNELLPQDWMQHDMTEATVISIWFEKKQPKDYKVIIPSPVYGPKAQLIKSALNAINISCDIVESQDELLFELIVKNLYILTSNISGLEVGGTVGELWEKHNATAKAVAQDVLDIQFKLVGKELDRDRLMDAMVKAFDGDVDHKCMGRSASGRLQRALDQAKELGCDISKLQDIAQLSVNV